MALKDGLKPHDYDFDGAGGAEVWALTGDLTLVDTSGALQSLDCNGATRNVTLPAVSSLNHPFTIVNTSAAALNLVVKNAGGATILSVGYGQTGMFWSDGTNWRGVLVSVTSATSTPANLYVSPTGNDENDGLTSGTALRTIAAAWAKIPAVYIQDVTINLASGTYNEEAALFGKTPGGNFSVSINGATSVIDTGTATAAGTNPSTLTDSGKSWTVNAYAQKWVVITGGMGAGQIRLIRSNTATALTVFRKWDTTPNNTSTYTIFDLASNGLSIMALNRQKLTVNYVNCDYATTFALGASAFSQIIANYCRAASNNVGLFADYQSRGDFTECVSTKGCRCSYLSFFIANGTLITGAAGVGFSVGENCFAYLQLGCEVNGSGSHGISVASNGVFNSYPVTTDGWQLRLISNGGWGLVSDYGGQALYCTYPYYNGNVSGTYSGTAARYAFAG